MLNKPEVTLDFLINGDMIEALWIDVDQATSKVGLLYYLSINV